MEKRLSPTSAGIAAVGALVVSLAFGSETFTREVVVKPSVDGDIRTFLQVLSTPSYSKYFLGRLGGTFDKWSFIVVFTIAVFLLVLSTARRGTGFVAGWTATIAAGAVAGFARGMLVNDTYGYAGSGRGTLVATFQFAGQGANYGLVIGWGVGLLVLFGSLLGGRSTTPVGPPAGAPPGGWPSGPGGPAPSAPPPWAGGPSRDDAWAPAPPPPAPGQGAPDAPEQASPIADDDATTVLSDPPKPDPNRTDPSGWSRPPADG